MLDKAVERRDLRSENQQLKQQLTGPLKVANIVGRSRKMHELLEMVQNVAPSDANCLIQGENGTGKELIANAIHSLSKRARGPFIKVNCAAIPKDLIESELFGYKKGAFTGAMTDKEGLFEMANGGSLLLDEIGEMPRVSPDQAAARAAGARVPADRQRSPGARRLPAGLRDQRRRRRARCATASCARISTSASTPSPSRCRRCASGPKTFRCSASTSSRSSASGISARCESISPAAYQVLMRHRWPGNVRELENVIERGVLVAKGNEIAPEDFPETVRQEAAPAAEFALPPHRTLAEIEKMAIVQTLQRTNWNKQEAAQILGLYRPTLYSKMKKHAIEDMGRMAQARRAREAAPMEMN